MREDVHHPEKCNTEKPRSGNLYGSNLRAAYKLNWKVAPPENNMKLEQEPFQDAISQSHARFLEGTLKFIFKQGLIIKWGVTVTTQQLLAHSQTWIQIAFKSVTIRAKGLPMRNQGGLWHFSSNWKSTTLPRSSKYPYVENKLLLISNTFTLKLGTVASKNGTQCRPGLWIQTPSKHPMFDGKCARSDKWQKRPLELATQLSKHSWKNSALLRSRSVMIAQRIHVW